LLVRKRGKQKTNMKASSNHHIPLLSIPITLRVPLVILEE
jgi:hypothetical protein